MDVVVASRLMHPLLRCCKNWEKEEAKKFAQGMVKGIKRVSENEEDMLGERWFERLSSNLISYRDKFITQTDINAAQIMHHVIMTMNYLKLTFWVDGEQAGIIPRAFEILLFSPPDVFSEKEFERFIQDRIEIQNEPLTKIQKKLSSELRRICKALIIGIVQSCVLYPGTTLNAVQIGVSSQDWTNYIENEVVAQYADEIRQIVKNYLLPMVDIDEENCLDAVYQFVNQF